MVRLGSLVAAAAMAAAGRKKAVVLVEMFVAAALERVVEVDCVAHMVLGVLR